MTERSKHTVFNRADYRHHLFFAVLHSTSCGVWSILTLGSDSSQDGVIWAVQVTTSKWGNSSAQSTQKMSLSPWCVPILQPGVGRVIGVRPISLNLTIKCAGRMGRKEKLIRQRPGTHQEGVWGVIKLIRTWNTAPAFKHQRHHLWSVFGKLSQSLSISFSTFKRLEQKRVSWF